MLSKKDIVVINKEMHTGRLSNQSSLDFAIDKTRRSKNWLNVCATIVRAIIVDHVFEDGNKRTAAAVIMVMMEMNDIEWDKEKMVAAVVCIEKKNVQRIPSIERLIKDAIQ